MRMKLRKELPMSNHQSIQDFLLANRFVFENGAFRRGTQIILPEEIAAKPLAYFQERYSFVDTCEQRIQEWRTLTDLHKEYADTGIMKLYREMQTYQMSEPRLLVADDKKRRCRYFMATCFDYARAINVIILHLGSGWEKGKLEKAAMEQLVEMFTRDHIPSGIEYADIDEYFKTVGIVPKVVYA